MLTDEQQVRAVIHSLRHSWDHMKMTPTHNEYIKTFEDVRRHLELEEERQEAAKMMGAKAVSYTHLTLPTKRIV